jgi:hypothetical protein
MTGQTMALLQVFLAECATDATAGKIPHLSLFEVRILRVFARWLDERRVAP